MRGSEVAEPKDRRDIRQRWNTQAASGFLDRGHLEIFGQRRTQEGPYFSGLGGDDAEVVSCRLRLGRFHSRSTWVGRTIATVTAD